MMRVFSHWEYRHEWSRKQGWFSDQWTQHAVPYPVYIDLPDYVQVVRYVEVECRPTLQEQRQYEIDRLRHKIAVTELESRLVRAEAILQAERDLAYAIASERLNGALLDLKMEGAERRAILREAAPSSAPKQLTDDRNQREKLFDDALYDARAKLRASGSDSQLLDAVVEDRQRDR
jgi:hypothetical protein